MSAADEEAAAFARHLHRRSSHGVIIMVCPTEDAAGGYITIAGATQHQALDGVRGLLSALADMSAQGAACCGGCADRHARVTAALEALSSDAPAGPGSLH